MASRRVAPRTSLVHTVPGTTDALGGVTRYAYDDRDNLLSLTDANENTHRFTYDRLNRDRA